MDAVPTPDNSKAKSDQSRNAAEKTATPSAVNAPTAMELLRGVERVRKGNVPLKAKLTIKEASTSANYKTSELHECLVECEGRNRRFEELPSQNNPWKIITLRNDDRFYRYTTNPNEVIMYHDDSRSYFGGIRSFDPRILGLIEQKALSREFSLADCLHFDSNDIVQLMGEEAINGIKAWHVKVTYSGTTDTNHFWITDSSFQVIRRTRELSKAFVDIRAEYDENDSSYPLPKRVIDKRTQTVPTESFESEQEITLSDVEWPKSIPAERFTLKSMTLPKNAVIKIESDGRIQGYWNGEEISPEPIPEAKTGSARRQKRPLHRPIKLQLPPANRKNANPNNRQNGVRADAVGLGEPDCPGISKPLASAHRSQP